MFHTKRKLSDDALILLKEERSRRKYHKPSLIEWTALDSFRMKTIRGDNNGGIEIFHKHFIIKETK